MFRRKVGMNKVFWVMLGVQATSYGTAVMAAIAHLLAGGSMSQSDKALLRVFIVLCGYAMFQTVLTQVLRNVIDKGVERDAERKASRAAFRQASLNTSYRPGRARC